jgi:hypothetical protein
MRVYIIGNDGLILCREPPAAVNEGEIVVASKEELHAAQLSGKRLLALWNALPGVEKRKKVGDRGALIDQLWSAIEALTDPDQQSDTKRASKQEAVIAMLQAARGRDRRRSRERYGLAAAHSQGALFGNPEEEARAEPCLGPRGAWPGLPHCPCGAGMSRAVQDATACREALSPLPELNLGELCQQWRILYKTRHRRISAASCWCELSHTGCRKSLLAGCAPGGSASSTELHSSSKNRSSDHASSP